MGVKFTPGVVSPSVDGVSVKFTPGVESGDFEPVEDISPVSETDSEIKFVVDVYRERGEIEDVYVNRREVDILTPKNKEVDVVRPGGTVVNIGAGPVLPPNPYEGQVWILT